MHESTINLLQTQVRSPELSTFYTILIFLYPIDFTWQSLLPALLAKVPQLMTIPASASVESTIGVQHANFPHSFPAHYARLLMVQSTTQQASSEPRDMALRKLTKLLYFITSSISFDANNRVVVVPAMQSSLTAPECAAPSIALAQTDKFGQPLLVLPGAVDVMQLLLVSNYYLLNYIS